MSDKTAQAKITDKDADDSIPSTVSEPSLNLGEIRELADLVNEYGFTDFEFENEKIKVRLSKQVNVLAPSVQPVTAMAAPQVAQSTADQPEPAAAAVEENLHTITSPIVGTYYSAPGPDKDLYVNVGSTVTPETVVCIVEAMKLMNEIQAETSGEVVKIYVENGQPVEYGQPLFGIKE